MEAKDMFDQKTAEVVGEQPASPRVGDVSAELSEYGIHRGLKSHHIQLMAISGVIGTGLFVGTSGVLNSAGPAGLLIGYSLWCVLLLFVAHAMGEISALLPVPGSFVSHIGRFVDESASVAMGWVYAYRIFVAADCTALTGLWAYWFPDINPGVWVASTLSVVFALNCLAVKYFGEVEFCASILKVLLIFGFLLFALIVVCGGNPHHERIGFKYWVNPGAFNEQYIEGGGGRFLAIWGVFNTAAFAIGGPDFIANCAPEAVNPRRNIPKAVKRVIYRLIFFFILSVFFVGLLVPYNDPTMVSALATGNGVAKSPFIIAMNKLDIPFLPDLCNAVIITSAWSCTNCLLFQASRTVFGLAKHGRAPAIFAKTTKSGVPLPALILSIAVSSLAFLTCNTASAVVLNWFINLGSTAIMIAYLMMLVSNIRFHHGLKAQGIDLSTLPFKSRLTPWGNYFALFWIGIILLTNGYGVFIKGHWKFVDFFTAYFTIVFFVVIYLGWKIVKRTPFIKAKDMDFQTGLAEVELHESRLNYKPPAGKYDKAMDWLF
ncbi:amino acid permease/ SLC12A domain-containing protein [Hypoxylon rubiginosum]|uniref:Amino acid permease/ SLC12A domain-containing protein n=1 Tax=Hypoxylon rubiginosum TaxID=110542 RepID=A0ACC0DAP0_9PEZI|nr:amino acid permease/ SLC12A domain-containing protein [Hypoxylon rubiginosum]